MRRPSRVSRFLLLVALLVPKSVGAQEEVPGVRVWFHSSSADTTVKLYLREMHEGEERYVLACAHECRVVLPRGARVRTVIEGSDAVRDFELEETGRDLDIDVRRPSKGALAGGIVMVAVGGLGTLIGLIVLGVGYGSSQSDAQSLRNTGLVTTLIGGGLTIGGVVLMQNRSTEPRVEQRRADRQEAPKIAEERVFPAMKPVFGWSVDF